MPFRVSGADISYCMKRNLFLSFTKATRLLLAALICLPFWSTALMADTTLPEAYAVLDYSTGTLTFKYDNNHPSNVYEIELARWSGDSRIKKVVFDPSFAVVRPTNCLGWFNNCQNLTDIEGISNLNTENVTDMGFMFRNCNSLTSLDLSSFNTENVTDMSSMFTNCEKLASLDLSSFKTDSVKSMRSMFSGCNSLTSLDLSSFKTDSVKSMSNMFNDCQKLESLNLSSFNTEKVTDMGYMFNNCYVLNSLNISSFNTEKVTRMCSMFGNCKKLASIGLSSFNTKNVKNMDSMFNKCSALTTLDLSSFNTENVTQMFFMFNRCPALTTIYASDKFVVTNVESDGFMFNECEKLKGAIEYDENKTNSSYANYTTGYFTFKIPTSINAINGNDKAEYFDINGKRGTKLQRGINLVRRGNKTYKVVVK